MTISTETTRPDPFHAPAVLPDPSDDRPAPDDRDAPAETDDSPPGHDDTDGLRFTFPELIDQEAMSYRAWGTPVGDFLASKMDELAQLVRWTHATTPDEHDARMAVWDAEIREQWEARGYEEGRRSACRCGESFPD